jgi:hypothetical protein
MGSFDHIAAALARVHNLSPAAARAAVALTVKAHQGDPKARASANRIAGSPKGKAILTSALAALQTHPAFWTSHYVASFQAGRAAPRYLAGDAFGEVSRQSSSAVGALFVTGANYADALSAVGLHPDNPDGMYAGLVSFIKNPVAFKNADHNWRGARDAKIWWEDPKGVAALQWPFHGGKWLDAAPKNDAQVRAVFKIPAKVGTKQFLAALYGFPFVSSLRYRIDASEWKQDGGGPNLGPLSDIAKAASSAVQSVVHDVSQVVSDPGKAIAKAASDIAANPAGVLSSAIQQVVNAAVPVDLLKPIPGLGDLAQIAKSYSPATVMGKFANAALRGDLQGVIGVAKDELGKLQAVASMVPGLGTGVSSAIGAAEALISGGNPIEIALRAAYGAIPIPPGLRSITDTVLDAVLALLHGGNVTDIALSVARDRIPEGMPRDVFDTLAQIVVRHTPIAQAAGELAQHEALKLAQGAGPAILQGLAKSVPADVSSLLQKLPDPSKALGGLPANLMGAAGLLSKLPAGPLQQAAAAAVAPLAKAQADRQAAMQAAKAQIHKAIALRLPQTPAGSRVLQVKKPLAFALGPAAPALPDPASLYDMFQGH